MNISDGSKGPLVSGTNPLCEMPSVVACSRAILSSLHSSAWEGHDHDRSHQPKHSRAFFNTCQ
jgi:hypothetical protein